MLENLAEVKLILTNKGIKLNWADKVKNTLRNSKHLKMRY